MDAGAGRRRHGSRSDRKEVQGMVRVLRQRYGLDKRKGAGREDAVEGKNDAEQVGFAW